MSARNALAWLIVFAFCGTLLLSGCTSIESAWYGCNDELWRGWDYQKECMRIQRAKVEAQRGLV